MHKAAYQEQFCYLCFLHLVRPTVSAWADSVSFIEGREGGWGWGDPQEIVFSNLSSNLTIPACVAQIKIPFPFFYCFFFMNPSPSAQNPISQPLKKANLSSILPLHEPLYSPMWMSLEISCHQFSDKPYIYSSTASRQRSSYSKMAVYYQALYLWAKRTKLLLDHEGRYSRISSKAAH